MTYFFAALAAIGYLATIAVLRRDINKLNRTLANLQRKHDHLDLRFDSIDRRQRADSNYYDNVTGSLRTRVESNSKLLKKFTGKRVQNRKRNRNRNLELTDGPS